MPTGYTHAVQDGKITTLREFAMTCARGMGALILMRDDPNDAPIPQRFEPNTEYHDKALTKAAVQLAELPSLAADECDKRAAAEFEAAMTSHTDYAIKKAQSKTRYEEMVSRVERWKVGEELTGLKDFMLEQLRTSLSHDCSGSYRPDAPVRLTGEEWRKDALAAASRDFAYHTTERAKEIARAESRNHWLDEFWKSLPQPPA